MKLHVHLPWLFLVFLLLIGCSVNEQLSSTPASFAESVATTSTPASIKVPEANIAVATPTSIPTETIPTPTATAVSQSANILAPSNVHQTSLLEGFSYGSDWTSTIAWSSDSVQLAWGTARGAVYIWQPPKPDTIKILLQTGPAVNSIKWSPDNSEIAVTTFVSVHLYETDTGQEIVTMNDVGQVNQVSWVENDKRIAIGKKDGRIEIWSIENSQLLYTLQGHTNKVLSVAWNRDGSQLASGSEDGTVRIWDVASEKELQVSTEPHSGVSVVVWSPDSSYVASGSSLNGEIIIWHLTNNQTFTTFKADTSGSVSQFAWSLDNQLIAATTNDNKIQMWNTKNDNEIEISDWVSAQAYTIGWSPNGTFIATGDRNGNLQLWGLSH